MSFAGDLEHLPIVDVIQLLHSTRKTGTLCLNSPAGESQLVFNDGYIVSANHVNNSIRIGEILVEMNAISQSELEQALGMQSSAGTDRKPLIATLIESGLLNKEDAYAGLETLIEMTIVEILTWSKGTFALDVNTTVVSDEYRYFPDTLKQEIYLNTQNVLMDALRIYDEKMRDGTLASGTFSSEAGSIWHESPSDQQLTVDDLGLEALDLVEKKIPDVFGGLKDYDCAEIHRQKIREAVNDLPQAEHEKLFSSLMELSDISVPRAANGSSDCSPLAVIVYSQDEFIKYIISTICKHENLFFVSTDEEQNLDHVVEQSLARELVPLLVIDAPVESDDAFRENTIVNLLQQKLEKYPQVSMMQLVAPSDYEFPLRALQAGARYVISRPGSAEHKASFVDDSIKFLKAFHTYIRKTINTTDRQILRLFKESIHELGRVREVPEVAFIPLRFASAIFERCITFVVGKSELVAEKGFGIKGDKSIGACSPLLFKIPLTQPSLLKEVIDNCRSYYGLSNDAVLRDHLFAEIGAPLSSKVMLMPINNFGRVIAVIYGDFGGKIASPAQIDLLDIVARHAGLVLDNNFYRKKYEKPADVRA